jgi:hypothetical protein
MRVPPATRGADTAPSSSGHSPPYAEPDRGAGCTSFVVGSQRAQRAGVQASGRGTTPRMERNQGTGCEVEPTRTTRSVRSGSPSKPPIFRRKVRPHGEPHDHHGVAAEQGRSRSGHCSDTGRDLPSPTPKPCWPPPDTATSGGSKLIKLSRFDPTPPQVEDIRRPRQHRRHRPRWCPPAC